MDLKNQKRLSAGLLKCSGKRIVFDPERLEDIKEAITKKDIRELISDKAITRENKKGVSRARANKIKVQRSKGRRKGHGSKKGKHSAREPQKESWMKKVRLQRSFITELKEKGIISKKSYQQLYSKVKGGFFRSRKHIKIYINEHSMVENAEE